MTRRYSVKDVELFVGGVPLNPAGYRQRRMRRILATLPDCPIGARRDLHRLPLDELARALERRGITRCCASFPVAHCWLAEPKVERLLDDDGDRYPTPEWARDRSARRVRRDETWQQEMQIDPARVERRWPEGANFGEDRIRGPRSTVIIDELERYPFPLPWGAGPDTCEPARATFSGSHCIDRGAGFSLYEDNPIWRRWVATCPTSTEGCDDGQ